MRLAADILACSVLLSGVLGATISRNSRCGSSNGGATCPSNVDGPGACCSSHGWCGNTEDHCGTSKGCQSAFGSCTSSAITKLKVSPDGSCGKSSSYTCQGSAFGDCCSQYGWCGRTSAYCAAGCQNGFGTCLTSASSSLSTAPKASSSSSSPGVSKSSSTATSAKSSSTQTVSNNARCGAGFGNQTCKGSKWGICCSKYFYCGSTDAYCGAETCQKGFGDCIAKPESHSPATSTLTSGVSSTSTLSAISTSSSSTSKASLSSVATSSTSSDVLSTIFSTSSHTPTSSSTSDLSASSFLLTTPASSEVSSTLTSTIPSDISSDISSTTSATPTPSPESSISSSISSDLLSTSSTVTPTPLPTPTPVGQVVINPGFEDATVAPWILYPFDKYEIVDTGDPKYGSKTPRTPRVGSQFTVRQIPSFPAGTYVLRFSIKVEGPNPENCQLYSTHLGSQSFGAVQTNDWVTQSVTFTTTQPTNTEYVRIVLGCGISAQTGFVYFDNLTITSV